MVDSIIHKNLPEGLDIELDVTFHHHLLERTVDGPTQQPPPRREGRIKFDDMDDESHAEKTQHVRGGIQTERGGALYCKAHEKSSTARIFRAKHTTDDSVNHGKAHVCPHIYRWFLLYDITITSM